MCEHIRRLPWRKAGTTAQLHNARRAEVAAGTQGHAPQAAGRQGVASRTLMGRDSCTRLCFRLDRGPSTRALASRKCTCRHAGPLANAWRLCVARHMWTCHSSRSQPSSCLTHIERVGAEHPCRPPVTCLSGANGLQLASEHRTMHSLMYHLIERSVGARRTRTRREFHRPDLDSTRGLPRMMMPSRARVSATFSRRGSDRKPMPCAEQTQTLLACIREDAKLCVGRRHSMNCPASYLEVRDIGKRTFGGQGG